MPPLPKTEGTAAAAAEGGDNSHPRATPLLFPFERKKNPVVISRKKSRGENVARSLFLVRTHAGDEVGQSVCSSSVFSVPRGASAAMNEKHRRRRRKEGNQAEIFPMEKGKGKDLLQVGAQAKPLQLCGKKI